MCACVSRDISQLQGAFFIIFRSFYKQTGGGKTDGGKTVATLKCT